MQKVIIVSTNRGEDELRDYLERGWRVVQTCPMPSSMCGKGSSSFSESIPPTALVIIEK